MSDAGETPSRNGATERFEDDWKLPVTPEDLLATMREIYGGA